LNNLYGRRKEDNMTPVQWFVNKFGAQGATIIIAAAVLYGVGRVTVQNTAAAVDRHEVIIGCHEKDITILKTQNEERWGTMKDFMKEIRSDLKDIKRNK
jgi:hypothetical protein